MKTYRIGFGYEQEAPGLYIYDETGSVVASSDTEPSYELMELLDRCKIDTNDKGK